MKKKKSTFDREMEDTSFKKNFDIEYQKEVMNQVIGLTPQEAKKLWGDIRIVRVDGNACIVTCDFNISRMNVWIENGIITKVNGFG